MCRLWLSLWQWYQKIQLIHSTTQYYTHKNNSSWASFTCQSLHNTSTEEHYAQHFHPLKVACGLGWIYRDHKVWLLLQLQQLHQYTYHCSHDLAQQGAGESVETDAGSTLGFPVHWAGPVTPNVEWSEVCDIWYYVLLHHYNLALTLITYYNVVYFHIVITSLLQTCFYVLLRMHYYLLFNNNYSIIITPLLHHYYVIITYGKHLMKIQFYMLCN